MEDFKQVRESLIDMLEELDERLGKITNEVKQLDEKSSNDLENPDEEAGKALAGNNAKSEIEKIKKAITQIDVGSYGICLQCGQPIKKERLRTSPLSQKCHHCAKNDTL